MRDTLTFDPWVQYLVARGYAVFQPNFRGSEGFGKAFAESGYGEWGRKMQDDLTDGVKALVDAGASTRRASASSGRPTAAMPRSRARRSRPTCTNARCPSPASPISTTSSAGASATGARTRRAIPTGSRRSAIRTRTKQRLREVSPLAQAASIKIPVLLIHGSDDFIVPIAQSKAMKKALDKAGRKTDSSRSKRKATPTGRTNNEIAHA